MLSYDELYREYERLKKENEILKAKLAVFKDYGGEVISVFPSVDEHTAVNKYSSSQEKIELFKSLFVGRSDVFAKRWYSKTTDKSGYQPVCENEWDDELCDKRKYKCSDCPNRTLCRSFGEKKQCGTSHRTQSGSIRALQIRNET